MQSGSPHSTRMTNGSRLNTATAIAVRPTTLGSAKPAAGGQTRKGVTFSAEAHFTSTAIVVAALSRWVGIGIEHALRGWQSLASRRRFFHGEKESLRNQSENREQVMQTKPDTFTPAQAEPNPYTGFPRY